MTNSTTVEWYSWRDGTLRLQLTIQPGASKNQVVGLHGSRLKLRIHARPVDGKANAELIAYVANIFATPKQRVALTHGAESRSKTVTIERPQQLAPELVALGLSTR